MAEQNSFDGFYKETIEFYDQIKKTTRRSGSRPTGATSMNTSSTLRASSSWRWEKGYPRSPRISSPIRESINPSSRYTGTLDSPKTRPPTKPMSGFAFSTVTQRRKTDPVFICISTPSTFISLAVYGIQRVQLSARSVGASTRIRTSGSRSEMTRGSEPHTSSLVIV